MRIRHITVFAFALTLAWTTSAAAQVPLPADELVAQWEEAFNAGDFASIPGLYTEDAVRMPPARERISGRKDIERELSQFAGFTIELTALGGMLGGNIGSSWGEYELSGEIDGEPFSQNGRWMNALKKSYDGWQIHRDTWNIIEPAAE